MAKIKTNKEIIQNYYKFSVSSLTFSILEFFLMIAFIVLTFFELNRFYQNTILANEQAIINNIIVFSALSGIFLLLIILTSLIWSIKSLTLNKVDDNIDSIAMIFGIISLFVGAFIFQIAMICKIKNYYPNVNKSKFILREEEKNKINSKNKVETKDNLEELKPAIIEENNKISESDI